MLELPEYGLVYWDLERSVTAIKTTSLGSDTPVLGKTFTLKFRGKDYSCQLAALGQFNNYCYRIVIISKQYFKGTKSEMEVLEGRFVVGDWTPTFLSGESPTSDGGVPSPTTKRKRKGQPPNKKNGKFEIILTLSFTLFSILIIAPT